MSSRVARLIGVGVQPTQAAHLATRSVRTDITSAGTTLSDATELTAEINVVETAAASSGVRLSSVPIGESIEVTNLDADTINVFPPTAAQQLNAIAAGSATTVAQNKTARFTRTTATKWRVVAFD